MAKHKVPGMAVSLNEGLAVPTRRYMFIPLASYHDQLKVIFDYMMKDLKAKNPRLAFIGSDNSS